MNRSTGLIQRRNVVVSSNTNATADNESNEEKTDREETEDDFDSKETRLTLMEEILLLGLKDKEVG